MHINAHAARISLVSHVRVQTSNNMDILEPFIDAPEGLSLLADNNKYLCRYYRDGRNRIEASSDIKTRFTKFLVKKTSDGKRILLKADNDFYCCLWNTDNVYYMEASWKAEPNEWCEFEVFNDDHKLVLKGHNGLFITRWYRDGVQSIEASMHGINSCCQFILGVGDMITPKFEILDVTWDSSGESIFYNPVVVTEDTYVNNASKEIMHDFDLKWTNRATETTTWTHAWGFEASCTFKLGVLGASGEFQAKISYNGSYGTTSSKENEASFERKLKVSAAPFKKTTVKMVVQKADNVKLAFTAKVRRTNADGSSRIISEQGTWQGVSYEKVLVQVEEKDLKT